MTLPNKREEASTHAEEGKNERGTGNFGLPYRISYPFCDRGMCT